MQQALNILRRQVVSLGGLSFTVGGLAAMAALAWFLLLRKKP